MDLETLYKENYRIVYGYLLSLCHDPSLAEDLASETFLRGIQHINQFQSGKISTWLCAIGRNLYFNEKKRQKHHVPIKEESMIEATSMEDSIADKELAGKIAQVANTLKEPQKSVFFMRLQEMSFRDIGEAVGKNENWARVTFFRVKNEIMKQLEVHR